MARDPNLERLISTLTAPKEQPKPKGVGIADFAKQLAGGAVQATGLGLRGAADPIQAPVRSGQVNARQALLNVEPAIAAGDALSAKGDALAASVSPAAKQAMSDSTPSGELLHPSTWSLGENPSVTGYALQAANVLGQVAPVLATAAVTKGRVLPTAGVAAALGGGAAGQQEQQRIDQMPQAELDKVPAYQKLIGQGADAASARALLGERTGTSASLNTMPVSALSAFTEGLPITEAGQAALGKIVGTSRLARAGTGALLESVGEGAQEAGEQVAQTYGANQATGEQRSLGTDTFQNAVLGAIGAAPLGVAGGVMHAPHEAAHDAGSSATTQPNTAPVAAPAPAPAPAAAKPSAADQLAAAPVPVSQAPAFTATQHPITQEMEVAPGVVVHADDGVLSKALVEGAKAGAMDTPATTTLSDGTKLHSDTGEVLAPGTGEAPAQAAPALDMGNPISAPAESAASAPVPQSTASVPFMITAAQRRDLAARGYDGKSIAKMTPAEAQDVLAQPAPSAPATDESKPVPSNDDLDAIVSGYYDAYGVIDAQTTGIIARRLGVDRQVVADAKKRVTAALTASRSTTVPESTREAQSATEAQSAGQADSESPAAAPGHAAGAAAEPVAAGHGNDSGDAAGTDRQAGIGSHATAESSANAAPDASSASPAPVAGEQRSSQGAVDTAAEAVAHEADSVRGAVPSGAAAPASDSADAGAGGKAAAAAGAVSTHEQASIVGGAAAPDAAPAAAARAPMGKWFGTQDKAQAYLKKAGLTGSHEAVPDGRRFVVQPKAAQGDDTAERWSRMTTIEREAALMSAGMSPQLASRSFTADPLPWQTKMAKAMEAAPQATVKESLTTAPQADSSANVPAAAPAANAAARVEDNTAVNPGEHVVRASDNTILARFRMSKSGDKAIGVKYFHDAQATRNVADEAITQFMSNRKGSTDANVERSQSPVADQAPQQARGEPETTSQGEASSAQPIDALKKDKAFRQLMRESGDPHIDSPVASNFAQGYADQKAGRPLDRSRLPTAEQEAAYGPGRFNPVQAYVSGYVAATTGKGAEVRGHEARAVADGLTTPPKGDKPAAKTDTATFTGHEAPTGATFLYENDKGDRVYLDDNGRFVLDGGARVYQKREMRPTRAENGGIRYEQAAVPEARFEQAEATPKAKPAVSANTIFTEDAYLKARAILKAKLGQLSSGIDPEIMQAGIAAAGYHIEKGARTFVAYAKAMVADLGDSVKPYLKSWYMGVKYDPRASAFDGMSTAAEVEAADVTASLAEAAKENTDEPASTDSASAPALDEVPAGKDAQAESAGDVGGGDAERSTSGAGRDRTAASEGVSGARSGGSGAAEVHPAETRARRRRAAAAAEGAGVAGEGVSGQSARVNETPAAPNVPSSDFQITDDVRLGKGGEVEKFNDNLAAIKVIKALESENRRATAAEQAVLARYVGWGGLANAFAGSDGTHKEGWEKRGRALAELLTPKELAAARRSTRNAHYTSQAVVQGMWKAMDRLGFAGGTVLEPSMGTGNFLGLMPENFRGKTRFVGIELDHLTARIAGALYANETVLASPFQKVPLAENSFDAAIGNPPFGNESLNFQFSPELNGQSIHNQFFLASLDAVKPGGVMSMVVSRYLLDKKDSGARRMLAERADLIGAIRLPDTAFKENARTEVVTDILFFRKHTEAEGAARAKAREDKAPIAVPAWVETQDVADPLGGEPITLNRYFAENPHMMLGVLERSGSMRHGADVTLRGEGDFNANLDKAIGQLPAKVISTSHDAVQASLERYKGMTDALKLALSGAEAGAISIQPGGALQQVIERETPEGGHELTTRTLSPESPWSPNLYQDDKGRWFRMVEQTDANGGKVKQLDKQGNPTRLNAYTREVFANDAAVPARLKLGKAAFERLSALTKLRDLLKSQLTLEAENAPAAQISTNRTALSEAYTAFQKENGYINDPNNAKLVSEMPDGALVLALEHGYRAASKTSASSAKPAPILSERVVVPYTPPTKASSAADALAISLAETGHVDMPRIAALLETDEAGVIDALHDSTDKPLVFHDPESNSWVARNDYLTGLVRRKLEAARAAGLDKNIAALEKVQPEPWGPENVSVALGASWVPGRVYADFAEHLLGGKAHVHYSALTNAFSLNHRGADKAKAAEWSTQDAGAEHLLSDLLNSKSTTIRRSIGDGKTVIDEEATTLAQIKRKAIAAEFADWVYAQSERREQLVDLFNDKFNTRVARQHDGSHLTLPGKVPDAVITMRRHQKNAIWRGISERFMLVDHVVGAGKTFTAIARAMERRRMGLARKPMIAVPNHLVDQWAADVYRLYPGAKVLAAGTKDFEKMRRRRLFAKVATGDYDIVIVPHSSFGFIGIAPETEERYLTAEIERAEQAMVEAQQQADDDGVQGWGTPFGVKEAERVKEKLEQRLDKLKSSTQDKLLTFEQMGVDDLTIDEAHEFKNLFYTSRLTGVRGMGDKAGSRKALDLYNKVRVLRESPTGAVTFMTGTPISNSAVEMFTMMRYLAADELRDAGLENFDAWRSQFVDAEPAFEPTETGGLKEVTRLGRSWTNMRSLMETYGSFTDSVSADDIEKWYAEDNEGARFPVPAVAGGARQQVITQPTPAQVSILNGVIDGFNGLKNISNPKDRNAERLRLMDRARKVALDARAAGGDTPDNEAGGKLQLIADEVAADYRKWNADKGTQLIFLDRSVPKAKGDDAIIKEFDQLQAKAREAMRAGDEAAYMAVTEKLEKFDANEIAELRNAQAGGWNAYQQIKDNLIDRGVPANEIRFVQEANNDAQKKALFDAVNAGEVRVLIGSTPRMGAGTNVQERLVALHHADVTWKPSDIEQREGRIIRQGNQLLAKYGPDAFEVNIKAYATERTIDAKMWDLNSQKLKTINGIRKYDGEFSMDFEDEDAVGMAEMAALASGDPMLMERVKLTSQIDKLELVERAQKRRNYGLQSNLDAAKKLVATAPPQIARYREAEALMKQVSEQAAERKAARTVTVEGQTYSTLLDASKAADESIEQQKAGEKNARYAIEVDGKRLTTRESIDAALASAIGDNDAFDATVDGKAIYRRTDAANLLAETINAAGDEVDGKKVGSLFGLPLVADVARSDSRYSVALTVQDSEGRTLISHESRQQAERKFAPATLRALVAGLADDINSNAARFRAIDLERRVAQAKANIPILTEQLAKPVTGSDELAEKRARLEDVIRALAAKDDNPAKAEFSKAERVPTRTLKPTTLSGAIAAQVATWQNAPVVRVVANASDLPASIRNAPGFDATVEAAHDRGAVYLIADRLGSLARAQQVLAHEVIGHFAMEQVIGGREFAMVREQIEAMRKAGKMPELFAELAKRYGDIQGATLASEALAVMAEKGMRNGILGRVMAAFRQFMRKLGFAKEFNETDLRQLINRAGTWLEGARASVRTAGQGVAFAQAAYHGTSHAFDAFSMQKIGTGTGRDAYGWGMYFASRPEVAAQYGKVHSVDVPDDADLLDYNKPISQQSPAVRTAMESMLAKLDAGTQAEWAHAAPLVRNGKRFYNLVAGAEQVQGGAKGASQFLAANGIPGLRYDTDNGHGYVIWDERAIGAQQPSYSRVLEPATPGGVVFGSNPYFVNGSGESSASLEAIHRIADEKAAGQVRMLIDRDGSVRPLFGVDAVDTFARPGQIIVQRNIGKTEWTVTSADAALGKDVIAGKVNAARATLQAEASELEADAQQFAYDDAQLPAVSWSKRPAGEVVDDIEKAARWSPTDLVPYLRDKREDFRPGWLGMLTLRQLAEVAGKYLPRISDYSDTVQAMQTRRTGLQEEAAHIADDWWNWQRKNRPEAKVLAKVMHDATLAGVDPAEAFVPGTVTLAGGEVVPMTEAAVKAAVKELNKRADGAPAVVASILRGDADRLHQTLALEQSRRDAYPALKAAYDALPEGARTIYTTVRDAYKSRADAMQKALIDRIGGLELPPEERKALSDQVRAHFESARVQAPYFPLARFGEYWVSAEKDGVREFRMTENRAAQRRVQEAYKAKGWTTKAGAKIDMARAIDGASASFMAQVTQTLSENGVEAAVADEIYQLYLRTLPDMSVRKQFIHRQGVAGYDEDALRAFAGHMNHGAYQLARLEHSHKMENVLRGLRKDAAALADQGEVEGVKAARAMAEVDKRHEWVMNPKDAAWVQKVSAANFAFYLGATPAAALVNLTQGAITTFPALAARHGWVKAMTELVKGMRQSIRTYGHVDKVLTGDELRAYNELLAQGAIDKTLSHDLAGMGEGSELSYNPAWRKTMQVLSHGFHKAEVFNRESAGMAAYRLSRQAGESHEAAVKYAADTIYQTHFDYANANRARFMQSNASKVLFAFKQYSQHMSYWLWRNLYQSIRGASVQEKREARRKLVGTLGMSALFAGTMGLPLMTLTMQVANAFASMFGDDDEPWDAETEFRNFLVEMLGPQFAKIAADGPVQALTGLGIASRTKLDQMWFKPSDQELEGRAQYDYWLEQVAGPVGGMFGNVFRANQLYQDGHLMRGVETMMPKAIHDGLKTLRYMNEGVNNLRGDPMITDVSPYELLMQAAGFSPARVQEQYQLNNSLKQYEGYLTQRRQALMDAYAMASRMRDTDMLQTATAKIEAFNLANPEIGITASTIRRSLMAREKYTERMTDGVVLNPKLEAKLRSRVLGSESE